MRFEFNQGVPKGCREWLYENVGEGNLTVDGYRKYKSGNLCYTDETEFAWFYERIEQEIPSSDPSMDSNTRYVPTITVKDEKKAMLFALRWL